MQNNLQAAKKLLDTGEYTCVLCKDSNVFTSTERGVKPLIEWLDSENDFNGYAAADKVVGKAAAFLYVLLKVGSVYAKVISEPAADTLKQNGIPVAYEKLVKAIKNRKGDGFCPMEQAVRDAIRADKARLLIEQKLKALQSNKKSGGL